MARARRQRLPREEVRGGEDQRAGLVEKNEQDMDPRSGRCRVFRRRSAAFIIRESIDGLIAPMCGCGWDSAAAALLPGDAFCCQLREALTTAGAVGHENGLNTPRNATDIINPRRPEARPASSGPRGIPEPLGPTSGGQRHSTPVAVTVCHAKTRVDTVRDSFSTRGGVGCPLQPMATSSCSRRKRRRSR